MTRFTEDIEGNLVNVDAIVTIEVSHEGEGERCCRVTLRDGNWTEITAGQRDELDDLHEFAGIVPATLPMQCVVYWSDDQEDWHFIRPVVAWLVRRDGTASPVIPGYMREGGEQVGLILPNGEIDEEWAGTYENLEAALEHWKKRADMRRRARQQRAEAKKAAEVKA